MSFPPQVFFRNDDVARQEPGLCEVTELFTSLDVPISHAVEPRNLEPAVADWLRASDPALVQIMQHGYSHAAHDRGEFGGARPAREQEQDLVAGLAIMRETFGGRFLPAMSFPWGLYSRPTPPILDRLGYRIISCQWKAGRSRQLFYRAGRLLRTGRLLDRHVSHHLQPYPGTRLLEVSVCLSPIAAYRGAHGGTDCEFSSLARLQADFAACARLSPVLGMVVHHRYFGTPERRRLLADFLGWLREGGRARFARLDGVLGERARPASAGMGRGGWA